MAHKTKSTLTRVAWEKIKRANAKRVRELREKEKANRGKDEETEDRGKRADSKE